MPLSEIIEKIDEADDSIRKQLKLHGIPLGERDTLEKARDLLQQAITPLLKYQD